MKKIHEFALTFPPWAAGEGTLDFDVLGESLPRAMPQQVGLLTLPLYREQPVPSSGQGWQYGFSPVPRVWCRQGRLNDSTTVRGIPAVVSIQ